MPNIFSLDASTKKVIQDVLDDFLAPTSAGGLGKPCLFVYPPKQVRCGNCVFDPVTNRSSNRGRSGAPVPFPTGSNCPQCGGRGLIEQEMSETVVLKCNWEPRRFLTPVPGWELRVPNSIVEVKGFLTDLPKLLRARHLVVNIPLAPYLRQEYVLLGEPGDPSNIVSGRYFVAVLEQRKVV